MKNLGLLILPLVIAGSAFSQAPPAPVPPPAQGQFFPPVPKPLVPLPLLPVNLKVPNPYAAPVVLPNSASRCVVPLLEMKAPEGIDTIAKIVPHPELIDPIALPSPVLSCNAAAPAVSPYAAPAPKTP